MAKNNWTLLERYTELNAEEARQSFHHFKRMMWNHKDKTLQEVCQHIICRCADMIPEFCTLAHISLTIPITSVPCERGFSAQNLIHTSLRSSLSVKSVENKLFIKSESRRTDFDQEDIIQKACQHFTAVKHRTKLN